MVRIKGNEITLLDIMDTGAELVWEMVETGEVGGGKPRKKLNILSQREKKSVELRYG